MKRSCLNGTSRGSRADDRRLRLCAHFLLRGRLVGDLLQPDASAVTFELAHRSEHVVPQTNLERSVVFEESSEHISLVPSPSFLNVCVRVFEGIPHVVNMDEHAVCKCGE